MFITQLATNVKGPEIALQFKELTGIIGHPRAGKSRVYQGLQLAVNGSLPRLGSKSEIMELVPTKAMKSGMLYARARFDTLLHEGLHDTAEFEADIVGGKVVGDFRHGITDIRIDGCLPTTEWNNLIELGDDLSLKELFWAFGRAIDISQLRGLSVDQEQLLEELKAELVAETENEKLFDGAGPEPYLALMKKLDSGARSLSSLINAKKEELSAIQSAEDESGARIIECPHCHKDVVSPSPGTAAAKVVMSKAEVRKQHFKGLLTEISRLITEQLSEIRKGILDEVQSHVPLGIKIDLQLTKQKCQWKVMGLDGRPHSAKVACGTERAALKYGLMHAWSAVRKKMGLPVIITLDDSDFGGLTLRDRRNLLESVAEDQKQGKVDQVLAVSAEDIFPPSFFKVEMEYAKE